MVEQPVNSAEDDEILTGRVDWSEAGPCRGCSDRKGLRTMVVLKYRCCVRAFNIVQDYCVAQQWNRRSGLVQRVNRLPCSCCQENDGKAEPSRAAEKESLAHASSRGRPPRIPSRGPHRERFPGCFEGGSSAAGRNSRNCSWCKRCLGGSNARRDGSSARRTRK